LGYNSQYKAFVGQSAIPQHFHQQNGADGTVGKSCLTGDKYQRHPDMAGI
jgi:hypothetical protein